jgi:hypothetical protein
MMLVKGREQICRVGGTLARLLFLLDTTDVDVERRTFILCRDSIFVFQH